MRICRRAQNAHRLKLVGGKHGLGKDYVTKATSRTRVEHCQLTCPERNFPAEVSAISVWRDRCKSVPQADLRKAATVEPRAANVHSVGIACEASRTRIIFRDCVFGKGLQTAKCQNWGTPKWWSSFWFPEAPKRNPCPFSVFLNIETGCVLFVPL